MTHDPGLASWLQLTLTPGLGAAALRAMLRQFGLPQSILQRKRSDLAPYATAEALALLDSPQVAQAVARALEWASAPSHHVITLADEDRKSTRLNSSHLVISYAVFCLKKKNTRTI